MDAETTQNTFFGNLLKINLSESQSQSPLATKICQIAPTLCTAGVEAIILAMAICARSATASKQELLHISCTPCNYCTAYRPIASPFLFQQLQNGLPIHVWRGVQPGDVENRRSQVDVKHQMRVSRRSACNIKELRERTSRYSRYISFVTFHDVDKLTMILVGTCTHTAPASTLGPLRKNGTRMSKS